jgi:hypothetical protein
MVRSAPVELINPVGAIAHHLNIALNALDKAQIPE